MSVIVTEEGASNTRNMDMKTFLEYLTSNKVWFTVVVVLLHSQASFDLDTAYVM